MRVDRQPGGQPAGRARRSRTTSSPAGERVRWMRTRARSSSSGRSWRGCSSRVRTRNGRGTPPGDVLHADTPPACLEPVDDPSLPARRRRRGVRSGVRRAPAPRRAEIGLLYRRTGRSDAADEVRPVDLLLDPHEVLQRLLPAAVGIGAPTNRQRLAMVSRRGSATRRPWAAVPRTSTRSVHSRRRPVDVLAACRVRLRGCWRTRARSRASTSSCSGVIDWSSSRSTIEMNPLFRSASALARRSRPSAGRPSSIAPSRPKSVHHITRGDDVEADGDRGRDQERVDAGGDADDDGQEDVDRRPWCRAAGCGPPVLHRHGRGGDADACSSGFAPVVLPEGRPRRVRASPDGPTLSRCCTSTASSFTTWLVLFLVPDAARRRPRLARAPPAGIRIARRRRARWSSIGFAAAVDAAAARLVRRRA